MKPNYNKFKDSTDTVSKNARIVGHLYGTVLTLLWKTKDKAAIRHCVESVMECLNPEDPFEKSLISRFSEALKEHGITIEN